MRVDLSKITFIAIKENISEFEIGDHHFTTSNRQHTLLFQSSRKIRTTKSSESSLNYNNNTRIDYNTSNLNDLQTRPSASNRPEMSKLTFLNIFDSHKPDEIEKLDSLYADCKGNLPSRRQLSAIAQSIGIQQSKIKKWFDKRKQEQEQEKDYNKYTQIDNENSSTKFWDDLNKKLDFIDNEINEIRKKNE